MKLFLIGFGVGVLLSAATVWAFVWSVTRHLH